MITLILEIGYVVLRAMHRAFNELYYISFISARIHYILKRNHPYYRTLGRNQRDFARTTWDFVMNNEFIGRDIKVTFPLKLMIASHAQQLSWKLTDRAYEYYDRIILYKDYYPSTLTRKLHKAEVNPGLKLIVFSARAIHESITGKERNTNVLLHEFAHALWLEHLLMHESYLVFDQTRFDCIRKIIQAELKKVANGETHYLRSYAFTNEAEFFAVAVEIFFEQPGEFRRRLPLLYSELTALFRQEPPLLQPQKP